MRNKGQNQSLRSRRILGTHGVPRPSPTAWVLITIDTDNVKATYPGPSQDQNNPTRIAHNMGFMVGPEAKVKSGKRTGDLSVTAQVGDTVYAFATSGSDNFEDAVLLYAMERFSDTQVFSNFNYQSSQKSTVAPNSTTQPLPAQIVVETFWFYHANVIEAGTDGHMVQFALYTRDNSGVPILYGYFAWDPSVTVTG